jgi:hypothetical protein
MQPKLSYANVMATMAVFIALGGGAYAATQIPNNSVGTKQLKNSAVTTPKIKNGAVTGAKIKLATLGKVPSAANADTVGGQTIRGFSQTVANGTTAQQTVLSLNGLTLTLSCGTGEPTVQAIAAVTGSLLRGTKIGISVTPAAPVGTSVATANVPVTVFTPTDARGSLVLHYLTTAGHRVDVNAVVDDTATINNFNGCLLEGTAIAG